MGLVVSLNVAPSTGGALVGLAVAGCGLAGAFLRFAGRPPVAWTAIVGGYAARRASGRHRHGSGAAVRGHGLGSGEDLVDLPESLGGLRILSAGASRGEVGIAREGSTWTAVLAVEGSAFALLELDDKERRLARWGGVLAGPARPGSPVSRIAWIDRTVTQPVDELGRYLRDGLSLPPHHPGVRSYLELLDEAGPAARQHETFLALQIDARRASGAIRRAGGRDEGAAAVLLRELAALAEHLQRAEVVVRGALSPRLLARAIRLGFCPDDRPGLDCRGAATLSWRAPTRRTPDRWPPRSRGATTAATGPFTAPTGSPSGPAWRSARTSSCRSCSRARRGARSRWLWSHSTPTRPARR